MVQAVEKGITLTSEAIKEKELEFYVVWPDAVVAAIAAGNSAPKAMEIADSVWGGLKRRKRDL